MTKKTTKEVLSNIKAKVALFSAKDKATIAKMVKDKTKITVLKTVKVTVKDPRTGKTKIVKQKILKKIGGQQAIAETLKTRKENIAHYLKTEKLGVRVTGRFVEDVKDTVKREGGTYKAAMKKVMNWQSYGTRRAKRHGKKWKAAEERKKFMADAVKRWKKLQQEGKNTTDINNEIAAEQEEYEYGSTPK